MHVTVSKKDLVRLLGRCQGVADKKSTMPVLGNVLIEVQGPDSIRLAATDLYLSVSGTIPASVEQGGSIAVGAKPLFERVKMMPEGNISISTDENATTTIRALGQPRRYTLHGIPGSEFPSLPEPGKGAEAVKLSAELLALLISSTHFSISTDETRLHLNSALFEWDGKKVRMVTTDGHRLSKMEATTSQQGSLNMLIPLKGVMELKRLCEEARGEGVTELELCRSGPNAFFRLGALQFGVKLVDAQFPPYDQVIPAGSSNTVRAPRSAVADALRAVSLAASDRTGGVKLSMDRGVMRFASESPESGDGFDEVTVDYTGDALTVGFNARYFLDVLGAVDGEELLLGISGELDPAVIRPAVDRQGTEYLAVIMPMRI
jgi:DNA polymerase III subunit beta